MSTAEEEGRGAGGPDVTPDNVQTDVTPGTAQADVTCADVQSDVTLENDRSDITPADVCTEVTSDAAPTDVTSDTVQAAVASETAQADVTSEAKHANVMLETAPTDVTSETTHTDVTPNTAQTDVTSETAQADVRCADVRSDVTLENDHSDIIPENIHNDITSEADRTDVASEQLQSDVTGEDGQAELVPEDNTEGSQQETPVETDVDTALEGSSSGAGASREETDSGAHEDTGAGVVQGSVSPTGDGPCTASIADTLTHTQRDAGAVCEDVGAAGVSTGVRDGSKEDISESCAEAGPASKENLPLGDVEVSRVGTDDSLNSPDTAAGGAGEGERVDHEEDVAADSGTVSGNDAAAVAVDDADVLPDVGDTALHPSPSTEPSQRSAAAGPTPQTRSEGAGPEDTVSAQVSAVLTPAESPSEEAESPAVETGSRPEPGVPVDVESEASVDGCGACVTRTSVSEATGVITDAEDNPSPCDGEGQDRSDAGGVEGAASKAPAACAKQLDAVPKHEGLNCDVNEHKSEMTHQSSDVSGASSGSEDCRPSDVESTAQHSQPLSDLTAEPAKEGADHSDVTAETVKVGAGHSDVTGESAGVEAGHSDVTVKMGAGHSDVTAKVEAGHSDVTPQSDVTAKVGADHSHITEQSDVTGEQSEATEAASAANSGVRCEAASPAAEMCGGTGVDDTGNRPEQQRVEQQLRVTSDGDSEESIVGWLGPNWEPEKIRIVMEARRPENSIADVARKYGMPKSTLWGQIKRFEKRMQDAGKEVPSEGGGREDSRDLPSVQSPAGREGGPAAGVGDGEGVRTSRRSSRSSTDAGSDAAVGGRRGRSLSSGSGGTAPAARLRRGSGPLTDSGARGAAGTGVSGRRGTPGASERQHSRPSERRSAGKGKQQPPPWSVLKARIAKSIGIPLADVDRYDRVIISVKCGRMELAAAATELGTSVERVKAAYVSYCKNGARFMWRSRVPAEDDDSDEREAGDSESTGAPGGGDTGPGTSPDDGVAEVSRRPESRNSGSGSRPGSACSLDVPRVVLDRSVTEQFIRKQSQSPDFAAETASQDNGAEKPPGTEPDAACRLESDQATAERSALPPERHLSTPSEADSDAHPGVPGWQLVYSSDDDVPLSPSVGDDDVEGGDAVLRPVSPGVVSAGGEGSDLLPCRKNPPPSCLANPSSVMGQVQSSTREGPGESSSLSEDPPVLEQAEELMPGEAPREGSCLGEEPPVLEQAEELPPRKETSVRRTSGSPPVEEPECGSSPLLEPECVSSPVVESERVSSPVVEQERVSSPAVEPERVSSPVVEQERVSSPVVEPERVSSPVVEPEGVSSPAIEPEHVSSPAVGQERVSSPVVEPEGVSSPAVEPEHVSSPAVEPEGVSSPVVDQERVSSPVVELERVSSPVVELEGVSSPVVDQERVSSPVVELERVSSPVVEPERASSPMVEQERVSSLVVEQERVSSPVVELEGVSSPVVDQERVSSPVVELERVSSPVVEPERASSPMVEQERVSSTVVEQERVSSPVVEPKGVSSPMVEPERVSSPVVDQERVSSPVVELERVSSPMVEQERVSSPVVEQERVSSPVIEPEGVSSPVVEPERVSSPAVDQERVSSPVVELERVSSPVVEPERASLPMVEQERVSSPVVEQERVSSPVVEPKGVSSSAPEPGSGSSLLEEPGGGSSPAGKPKGGSSRLEKLGDGSSPVEVPVLNPSVKEVAVAPVNPQTEKVGAKKDGSKATTVACAVKSEEPSSPLNSSQNERVQHDTPQEQRQAVSVSGESPPARSPSDKPRRRLRNSSESPRRRRGSRRQSGERSVSPDHSPRHRRGRRSAGERSHSRGERSHSRGERSHSRGERSHSRGEGRHSSERRGVSAERSGRERRSSKHHKRERRESKHRSHSKHAKKKEKKRHKEKKKKMKKERRHWESASASEAEEGARSPSQQRGKEESESFTDPNMVKTEAPVSETDGQPASTATDDVEEAPSKRQTRAEAKVKASEKRACSDSTEPAGNNAEPGTSAKTASYSTRAAESTSEPPPPAGVSTRRTRSSSSAADASAKSPAGESDDVPPPVVPSRDVTRSETSDTPTAQSTASRAAARAAAAEARAAAAAAANSNSVATPTDDTFPAAEDPAAPADGEEQSKAVVAGDETVTNMDRAMYAWLLGHMGSKKAAETFGVPKTLLRARRDAMQKEQRQAFVRRMKRFSETDENGGQAAAVVTPRRETRGSANAAAGPTKKGPSFEELMMAPEKMKTPAKATKKPAPAGVTADSASSEKAQELKLLSMEELKLVIADLDACRDQGAVSAQHKICKNWLSKFVEYRAVGKSVSDIHLLYTKTARARRDEENIKVAVSLCEKGHSVKKIARQSNLGLNVLKYHLRKHRGTLTKTGSAAKDRKPSSDAETSGSGEVPADVQEEEEAGMPPEEPAVAEAVDGGSRRSKRRWKPTDKILDSTRSPIRQSRSRERAVASPAKPAPSAPSPLRTVVTPKPAPSPLRTVVSPKPAPSPHRPGPMSRRRGATEVEPPPASDAAPEAAPPAAVEETPPAAEEDTPPAAEEEPAPATEEPAAAVEAPATVTDPAQRAELAARAANACERGIISRAEALAKHQLTEAEFVEAEEAIHRLVHIKRKLTTVAMRRAVAAVVRGQSQQKVAAICKVSAMALWKTLKKLREAGLIGQYLGKRRFMGGEAEPAASGPDPGAGGDGPPPVAPPASSDLPTKSDPVGGAATSAPAAPAAGGDVGQGGDLSDVPLNFRAAARDVVGGMTKVAAARKHGVCRKMLASHLIAQGILIRTRKRRAGLFSSRIKKGSGRGRISADAEHNPARAAYEAYQSGGMTQMEAAAKYGVSTFRLYYWGKKDSLKPRYKSDATASKSSAVTEENSRFDMIRRALKEAEGSSASKMSIARKYGMKYFTFMYYWKRQQDGKTLFVGRRKTHVRDTSEKTSAAPVFGSVPEPLYFRARVPVAVKELDSGVPIQQVAARYNLSLFHLERHYRLRRPLPDQQFSRAQMRRAVQLVLDHGFKMKRAASLYGMHVSEVNRKVLRPPPWIRDVSPQPECDVTPQLVCDVTPAISPEEIKAIDETMKKAVGAVILGKMPAKAASSLHRVPYLALKSLCERLTARYDSGGNVVLEPAVGMDVPKQEVLGSQPCGSPAVSAVATLTATPLSKPAAVDRHAEETLSPKKTEPRTPGRPKLSTGSPSMETEQGDGAGVTKLRLTKTAGGSYSSTPVKERPAVATGAGAAAVDSLTFRDAVERVVLLGEEPDSVATELKLEVALLSEHCREHPTPDSYLCTVRDEVFVMYTALALMEDGWDVNVDSLAWMFACFRQLSSQPEPPKDPAVWLHLPAIYRRWPELRGEIVTEPGAPTAEFESAFVEQLRQVCDEYEMKCSAQVLHDSESVRRRQTREVLPLPVAELPPTDAHVWDNRNGSWILEKDGKQQAFFEVDTILARRQGPAGPEYLIRWKGYTDSWNTWEPEGNLECTTTLATFTAHWEMLSALEQRRTIEELSPVPGAASTGFPPFPSGAPPSPGRRRGRGRYRGRGRGQRTLDSMLARRDVSTPGTAESPAPSPSAAPADSPALGGVRVRSDLTAAAGGGDVTAVTSDAETEERRSGRSTKSKANALFKEWLLSPKQITAQAMRESLQGSTGAETPDAAPRPEPVARPVRTPAPAATSTPLTERARRRPNLSLARVLPPAAGQRVLDEFVSRSPAGGASVAVMGRRSEDGVGTRTEQEKGVGDVTAAASEEEKETSAGDVSKTSDATARTRSPDESEVGKRERKSDRKGKSPRKRSSETRADKTDASPSRTPVKERDAVQTDAQREGVATRKGSSARKPDKWVPSAEEESVHAVSEKSVPPASEKQTSAANKKDSGSLPAPRSPAAPLGRTRARNKETRLDTECESAAEPRTPPRERSPEKQRHRRESGSAELRRIASETERLRRLDEELRLLDEEDSQESPADDGGGDGFSELEDEDDDGDATYKGTVNWNDSDITALVRSSVVKEKSKEREQKRRLSHKEAEEGSVSGVPESVKLAPPEKEITVHERLTKTSESAGSEEERNKDGRRVETGNTSSSTDHTPARKLPAGTRDGESEAPPAKKRRDSSPARQSLVLPPPSPGGGGENSGLKSPMSGREGDKKSVSIPDKSRTDDTVKHRDKQAPGRPAASKQKNENTGVRTAASPTGGLNTSCKGGITASTDGKRVPVSVTTPVGSSDRPGANLSASLSESAVGKRQRKLPKRFLDADTIFFSEAAPLVKPSSAKPTVSVAQTENNHTWDDLLELSQLTPEHGEETVQEREEGQVEGEASSTRQGKMEGNKKYKHLSMSEAERECELQVKKKIKILRDTIVVERHPSSVGAKKRGKSRDEDGVSEQETAPPKKRRKSPEETEEAEEPPRPITFQQPNKRKPIVFVSPIRKDQPETPVLPSMSAVRKLTLDVASPGGAASPKVRKVVMKVVVKPGPDGSPAPTISKQVSKPAETSSVSQRQGLKPGGKVLVKSAPPKPAPAAARPPPAVPQTSAADAPPMTILTPGADVVIEDGPVIINEAGELVPARTQQDQRRTALTQQDQRRTALTQQNQRRTVRIPQDHRRTVRISAAVPNRLPPPTAMVVKRKPEPARAAAATDLAESPSVSQITVVDSATARSDVVSKAEEPSVAEVTAVKDKEPDRTAGLAVPAEEVTPAAEEPTRPAKPLVEDTPPAPVAVVGKRRRGRPPKNRSGVSTPSTATPETTPKVSPESEATLPKRRGRPRKDSAAAAARTPAKTTTPATGKKRGRKSKREPTPEPEPEPAEEEEEPEEVTLDLSSLIGGADGAAAADDVGYFDVNGQFVERSPLKGLDGWTAGYGIDGAPVQPEGLEDSIDGSSTINMLENPMAYIDGEACEEEA